jgi:hypothetical protein
MSGVGNGRNNFCRFRALAELLYGGQNSNARSIYVVKGIMFIGEDGEK